MKSLISKNHNPKIELTKVIKVLELLESNLEKNELRNALLTELIKEEPESFSVYQYLFNEIFTRQFFTKFFAIMVFKRIIEYIEFFSIRKES